MENIESNISVSDQSKEVKLYVVSPQKFTILFLSTMGIYGLYWSYKNWSLYKSSCNAKVWPVVRGFFDIFFLHSLCDKLLSSTESDSSSKKDSKLESHATTYVILTIVGRVFDQLSSEEIGLPFSYFVSILLLPFTFKALYAIQAKANQLMGDNEGSANSKLTWANYVWILVGILFWTLIGLGGLSMFIEL
tara:strand:- start:2996 stop:3568 length:573 start_codon:yes stop_codon:yes gene_type:complete